jgi:peptidoglycan hydrolase-like protein with peptidoglycan-binding domain
MYPGNASRMLSPTGLRRFDVAYENRQLPIGWGEPNQEAVGLIQVYLHVLGYNLKMSVKVDKAGRSLTPDGKFGNETLAAVKQFQRDMKIKDDGMVGHDTLDALGAAIDPPRPAHHGFVEEIITPPLRAPKPCPPGSLICPDPDARPRP